MWDRGERHERGYLAHEFKDWTCGAAFGIRGVRFYVNEAKYGVSGSQPADVFLDALKQVWPESHPPAMVGSTVGNRGVYGSDSCEVSTG